MSEDNIQVNSQLSSERLHVSAECPQLSVTEYDEALTALRFSYGAVHACARALLHSQDPDDQSLSYTLEDAHERLRDVMETLQRIRGEV